jgi:hypothetical protein
VRKDDGLKAPVACSLSGDSKVARRQAWQRLSDRYLRARRATAEGMELTFSDREGVEKQLRELAALEADCCSFAEWRVRRTDGVLRLEITAPGPAVAAVHALFDEPT